ncbi:hypothetical protein EV360DRAFT_89163 [Lentinula raphanica]|nr:hypothetical protein EV360DRAFT_89163 [Lentinula raphanica]
MAPNPHVNGGLKNAIDSVAAVCPALHHAVPDAPKTRLFYESASYKQGMEGRRYRMDKRLSHAKEFWPGLIPNTTHQG